MAIGAFTDRNHCPTEMEMNEAAGSKRHDWEILEQWIRENYAVHEDLHFMYGKKYGWARRFRVGGALLTCLYPAENGITAQIILNQECLKRAEQLKLQRHACEAIARAKPYPEGKWLFIQVAGRGDVRDVEHLLELKRAPRPQELRKANPHPAPA